MRGERRGARSQEVVLSGVGMVLPGPEGTTCTDPGTFWSIVRDGVCCLSPVRREDLGLRVAGHVAGWDPSEALGLEPRVTRRLSRAGLLAAAAVGDAVARAGLRPSELDERTVLVCASLQFAFAEAERYFATLAREGREALRMDYWMTGTPPSVLGTVASVLGIACPTLSVTGSCNVTLRALDVVLSLFRAGDVDRAVLVGVDSSLDPVFASSSVYTSRQGYRASSLSDDPSVVRPHDEVQDGNATGEGAVAVVLERPGSACGPAGGRPHVRLTARTSRDNGSSLVAAGSPTAVAADMATVLDAGGRSLETVAFVQDYADGNRFVEDHFCAAVETVRARQGYDGVLRVTNQEAAFGHIAGVGGAVKLVSTALMLSEGLIGPVTNCRTPYRRLAADPVVAEASPLGAGGRDAALVVSAGAGGDSTTVLVEHLSGGFRV